MNRYLLMGLLLAVLCVPAAYLVGEHAGKKEGAANVRAEMYRAVADALAEQGEVLTKALEAEKTKTLAERNKYNRILTRLRDEKTCGDPVPACLRLYLDGLRD